MNYLRRMKLFKRAEVQAPLFFMLIGLLWIVSSDRILLNFNKNISVIELTYLQTVKGSLFIVAVSFVIYLMMKSSNKRLVESQDEYKELFYNVSQNEQNLLGLINTTEDLIWSIDNNFKYYTFNEPFQKAYKNLFNEELWIGKTALNKKNGDEHIEKWKKLYKQALNGEKFSIDMDFTVNNCTRFTTIKFNPIYNKEKKVIGVGCFLQDITERKIYEQKIEQQNRKLKEIAFITSHKVRVPLANILGLSEVLDKENYLNPLNCQIIEHIKSSAKQLDKTIIDMVQQTVHADE